MTDDSDDLEPIDLSRPDDVRSAVQAPSQTGSAWAPGWYADPWTAGQYRYWTGETWTGETNRWGPGSGPVSPTPGAAATTAVTEPWPAMTSPMASGYGWPAAPTAATEAAPAYQDAPKSRGPIVVGTVALIAVLLISGAVGYAIDSRSHSKKSVSAITPPSTASPSTTTPTPTTIPGPVDPDRHTLTGLVAQQSDVGTARMVVLIPDGNSTSEPTLDLCNGKFASEPLRTARLQVAAVDANGNTTLSTEAVLYRNPAASEEAFSELRQVSAACPHAPVVSPVGEQTVETTFNAPPDAKWPKTPTVVRQAYSMVTTAQGSSSPSIAVYLRRGRALLGLYFPKPTGAQPVLAGQRTIEGIVGVFEQRMAALPASVVNGHS
jgi:Protein of unknown function (DUF2510)